MDCFLCQKYIKHVQLVNKCYRANPTQPTQPPSNDLSYLLYYAKSKPTKLVKVGKHLFKTIQHDLHRNRLNEVLIGLNIFDAILKDCHETLQYFMKPLILTLNSVLMHLRSGSSALSSRNPTPQPSKPLSTEPENPEQPSPSTQTNEQPLVIIEYKDRSDENDPLMEKFFEIFQLFCRVLDFKYFSMDSSLRDCWNEMVSNLLILLDKDLSDLNQDFRLICLGFYCLNEYVKTPVIHEMDSRKEFQLIIPILLSSLIKLTKSPEESTMFDEKVNLIEMVQRKDSQFDKLQLNLSIENLYFLTWKVFENLMKTISNLHLKFFIQELMKFLEVQTLWKSSEFFQQIFLLMIKTLPNHLRYIIIAEILHQLQTIQSNQYLKKTMLIRALNISLNSPFDLSGISILEILQILSQLLLSKEETWNSSHQLGLIQTIGLLGKNIYYSDQLNDLANYLLNQFHLDDSSINLDDLNQKRILLFSCLTEIFNQAASNNFDWRSFSFTISPDYKDLKLLSILVPLFHHRLSSIRVSLTKFLISYMNFLTINQSFDSNEPTLIDLPNESKEALNHIHKTLYYFALNTNNAPMDYICIGLSFQSLLKCYQIQELVTAIPIMLKLQEKSIVTFSEDIFRQLSLNNLIANYFNYSGETFKIPLFNQYIQEIIKERRENFQWFPSLENFQLKDLEKENMNHFQKFLNYYFPSINLQTFSPISIFFSPGNLSGILSLELRILVNYPDLLKNLTLDYSPESTSPRHRSSRSLLRVTQQFFNDFKPPLNKSSSKQSFKELIPPVPTKVNDFKENLYHQANNSDHDTDTSSHHLLSKPGHDLPINQVFPEEQDDSISLASSTSLVRVPTMGSK